MDERASIVGVELAGGTCSSKPGETIPHHLRHAFVAQPLLRGAEVHALSGLDHRRVLFPAGVGVLEELADLALEGDDADLVPIPVGQGVMPQLQEDGTKMFSRLKSQPSQKAKECTRSRDLRSKQI